MHRCVSWAAAWVACTFFIAAQTASAQEPRRFPANALRGEIVGLQPPELLLNKRPARLAPGARIRGQNNMLLLSGAIVDQRLIVNYTLDTSGLVFNVWVLTPSELAQSPWPVTPEQAAAWRFNPDTQVWSRP